MSLRERREALARVYGYEPVCCPLDGKAGVAQDVRSGLLPVNGVRLVPEAGSTGWFIWAGEQMSDDDDYFEPLHIDHLEVWCPDVLPFLELPPGWRFLIAPGHEDVWFDEAIDLSSLG